MKAPRPHEQIVSFGTEARCGHFGGSGVVEAHGIAVQVYGGEAHLKAVGRNGRRIKSIRLALPFAEIDDLITALIAVRDGTD